LIIITCSLSAQIQSNNNVKNNWSLSIQYHNYNSYSQQKNDFPLIAGYPAIKGSSPNLALAKKITKERISHRFELEITCPTNLTSDNGTGHNYLLQSDKSNYFRTKLNYCCNFPLFKWECLETKHAIVAGILYENRKLTYLAGDKELSCDVNLYFGPGFKIKFPINSNCELKGEFNSHFYLPYLNYGKIEIQNSESSRVYSSNYHAFYYQTVLNLGIKYKVSNNESIHIGFRKEDTVGFANSRPLFYIDDMIHFKLYRNYVFYVKYSFGDIL